MKLLAEMRLEDEYNYNILLRMTSENFEEIFQLIKDDKTTQNTEMTELIPPRYNLQSQLAFYQQGNYKFCLSVLFFLFNYEQFNSYFFLCFRLLHFFFSNQKNKSSDLSSIH